MWLTSSSIGRKLIMSVTGAALILFLTFHALMNGVAIFWPQAYNVVCAFLGANWYALVASIGLAALFIIHIIYAIWLTIENRKARGNDRYEVTARPKQVEWSSRNMLVLGFVILAFLVLHLIQFWAKMQLAEILHHSTEIDGITATPQAGTLFLHQVFGQIWVVIVYAIAFVALWFHMTHGFWSMFHSAGWDNDIWIKRLKCIGNWWVTIVVGLFLAEAVVFTCMAMCPDKPYLNCPVLQEQYDEYLEEFQSTDNATCVLDKCEAAKECGHHNCDAAKAECEHHNCEAAKAECEHNNCDAAKHECKHHDCDAAKECAGEHECEHHHHD